MTAGEFAQTADGGKNKVQHGVMSPAVRVLVAALSAAASTLIGISVAAPASAATGWTSVSAGEKHTCGIRGGRIYCWGDNDFGQLGDNTETDRDQPTPINSGATDWVAVSAGKNHTCALRIGRISCWGDNATGQVGDGTTANERHSPKQILSGATDWKSVSAGGAHTCAVRIGRIACWGDNLSGQLGDGTNDPHATSRFILSGATDWTGVSAGTAFTCALRAGRIACWGFNGSGQLGNGTIDSRNTPQLITSGASDWKTVSAAVTHTCAIRVGRVACWGFNFFGQLGRGTASAEPAKTPGFILSGATDWTTVSAGNDHTCGRRAAGIIGCWGFNGSGRLGVGDTDDRHASTKIKSSATDWTTVNAGGLHSCGIRATRIACWGENSDGQLGNNSNGDSSQPVAEVS